MQVEDVMHLVRWEDITLRMSGLITSEKRHQRDITIPRVHGLTTDTLDGFFKILDELLTKLGIKDDPERILTWMKLDLGLNLGRKEENVL